MPFVHEASLDIPQQSVSSRLDSPRLQVATVQDSRVAQTIKRLTTMQETWVRSLGQEDPLEKGIATHSSTLAWKIPWTEEADGLQSMGSQRVGQDWATSLSLSFHCPGTGYGQQPSGHRI